jgi:malonyl-CoA O-methyltransferase
VKYYDNIAKGYNELYKEEQLEKIKEIKKHIKPKGLLLDIGAGTGISTKPFEKQTKCIALDPSLEMLKQYNGLKVQAKAESLPFKDNTFDTIISLTALHHTNIKKSLKEIKRVAKNNAQIALTILKKSNISLPFKKIEHKKDILYIDKVYKK